MCYLCVGEFALCEMVSQTWFVDLSTSAFDGRLAYMQLVNCKDILISVLTKWIDRVEEIGLDWIRLGCLD